MAFERRDAAVDLYWLPLGAGGHCVRLNGRVYEAVAATLQRRPRYDLYHSALVVNVQGERWIIEQAPAGPGGGADRGVVATGAVGAQALGRLRVFRYEIRCWRDGMIPDIDEAVESPRRVSDDSVVARGLLEQARRLPTPVWGRDEARTGEMWNSNSIVSWLLVRSGVEVEEIGPPTGGRAPGWDAGIAVARSERPAL